jgi:hypothetical protein
MQQILRHAIKGARYGTMFGLLVGIPVTGYLTGASARFEEQDNPLTFGAAITAAGAGIWTLLSPGIGGAIGTTYGICEKYGAIDLCKKNKRLLLSGTGVIVAWNVAYHSGYGSK